MSDILQPTPIDDDSGPTSPLPTEQDPQTPKSSLVPCSHNVCANQHYWPITFTPTPCQGCGAPIFAIKMENCPFCNEPPVTTVTRTDITTKAIGIQQVCQGEEPKSITAIVGIDWPAAEDDKEKGA